MSYLTNCDKEEARIMLGFFREVEEERKRQAFKRRQETLLCLQEAKRRRSLGAWSGDRTMLGSAIIPRWVLEDPELGKYMHPEIPFEDRAREQDKLLKKLAEDSNYGDFRVR